jgi:acetyltransferase
MSGSFENLFDPQSIVVIGASSTPGKVGYRIVENIVSKPFAGKLYLVNPRGNVILGRKAATELGRLPKNIDVAIVTTPQKSIPDVVEQCVERGVKNLIIFTAGFREMGEQGKAAEARLREIVAKGTTRLVGPNCAGICNPAAGLQATFEIYPNNGGAALISQSGSICSVVTSNLATMNIGISKYISLGNKIDVDEIDLLNYLADDRQTQVIVMYLEDISNGTKLLECARDVSLKKPVVVLKTGRTPEGAKATLSHTGALAGNDRVTDGAFKQMGLIRVDSLSELHKVTASLLKIETIDNRKLAILSDAGGPGVIATDAASACGFIVARPDAQAITDLKAILPDIASVENPIDITFTRDISLYAKSVAIIEKQGYGALLVTIPSHFDIKDRHVEWLSRARTQFSIPIAVAWLCADEVEEQKRRLWNAGIPVFNDPVEAVSCLDRICTYCEWKKRRSKGRASDI